MRYFKISIFLLLACPLMAAAATRTASPGTLTSTLNATQPGDTVILNGGTYTEGLVLHCDKSSQANPTTIRVASGATAILIGWPNDWASDDDGALTCSQPYPNAGNDSLTITGEHGAGGRGLIIDGNYGPRGGIGNSRTSRNVTIKNIEIKRVKGHGIIGSIHDGRLQNVYIHNVYVDDNGNEFPADSYPFCGARCHGLYLAQLNVGNDFNSSATALIENLTIRDSNGAAMTLSGGIYTVRNNTISRAGEVGIQLYNSNGTVNGTNVYNNVVYEPRGEAGGIFAGGNMTVYNNTLSGNNIYCPLGGVTMRNNIISGAGIDIGTGTNTFSNNMCSQPGYGCDPALVGNPGFVSAASGNFHLNCAGCNSVGTGANLSSVFTTDAEGLQRPGGSSPWDLGAYVLSASQPPPNPDPGTIVATYPLDAGSGTTVADATGGGHTGTWSECAGNACWTTGIIGPYAGNFNGSRYVEVTNTTGMKPTGAIAMTAWIKLTGTGTDGCDVASIGDSAKIHVEPNGNVSGTFYDGTTWREPFSSAVNALNGLAHFLGMSYNGTDVRVYLDGNQVAFQAATGAIQYTLGANFEIGRHGNGSPTYGCTGVIDQVSLFNGFCDAGCMMNLYNSQVPVVGMSIAHTGWFATGTPPTQLGATDTDRASHLITTPLGIRFAVRKADAGSLTEYLKPVCIVNTGAGFPAWTSAVELTNSFAPTGIRYYADAAITQGQATSVLLPTDSFTGINGLMLKSPIDTTSPYDAAQRLTIAAGQQADMLYEVEFGSPLVGGNSVQCRLVRENGADFNSYANIKTVTLLGISPPTSVQIGGVGAGGVQQ